ncbi:TECR reductase, partial [Pitta sordida]|nr:TECR reductase [Pitta sordida]
PQWYPARQSLRLDPKGRSLKDEDVLQSLPVGTTATLYFRDLGAQISWVTVRDCHPPVSLCHLCVTLSPLGPPVTSCVHLSLPVSPCHLPVSLCHLPVSLLSPTCPWGVPNVPNVSPLCPQNCTYYWGFSAWMAYYINHPLYTPPVCPGGGGDIVPGEVTLLSPCPRGGVSDITVPMSPVPGSKARKIPYPTRNPFTWLFLLVSCPNYTYEVGSWIGFTIMTQCLPVALFSLVGFVQMAIWAQGKHRSYIREFRDYPPLRSPIVPFLL